LQEGKTTAKAQSGTGPKDCYEKKENTGLFGGEA